MSSVAHRSIGGALGLVGLLTSKAASASFTPVVPSTCPTLSTVSWNYRVGGGTGVFDLPNDPNCVASGSNPCPHYINRLSHSRFFVSNTWVSYLGFRLASFVTETTFDPFQWRINSGGFASTSGTLAAGTVLGLNGGVFSPPTSFGKYYGELKFAADNSATKGGFAFDQVQYCTHLSAADVPTIYPPLTMLQRTSGILLGANDVVYLQFIPPSSTKHYPITLWSDLGTGDFDLYARCGALPTPTQYDYRAVSNNSQEYIDVTGCSGTVYVAVNSLSGSGVFSLALGEHETTGHISLLRAGTNFNASAAQKTTFQTTLREGARQFFGSTEGQQAISEIYFYNSGSCGATSCGGVACDICFKNSAGSGLATCNGGIEIFQSYFADPEGFSHELGHARFCANDEYTNPGPLWNCGHSNLANPWGNQNNFCTSFDHLKDPTSGAAALPTTSAWDQAWANSKTTRTFAFTSDNYDYRQFDFNNQIAKVTPK